MKKNNQILFFRLRKLLRKESLSKNHKRVKKMEKKFFAAIQPTSEAFASRKFFKKSQKSEQNRMKILDSNPTDFGDFCINKAFQRIAKE